MPKVFTSKTQKIGEVGENIAVKFLMKHDFVILERNYTKKWGEIDIIAKKADKIYFIEVKSMETDLSVVSHGTNTHRPEDNMHPMKLQRLSRTIQTYLLSKSLEEGTEWQVDLIVVYIDMNNKKSKVKVVKDIIL